MAALYWPAARRRRIGEFDAQSAGETLGFEAFAHLLRKRSERCLEAALQGLEPRAEASQRTVGESAYLGQIADSGDDPTMVTVPNVVGQPADQAQQTLEAEGFDVKRATDTSDRPVDEVIAQDPPANEQAEECSEVTITLSAGPETAAVPDVTGKTVDEASALLIDAGFVPSQKAEENADVEENIVIRTDPAANAQAAMTQSLATHGLTPTLVAGWYQFGYLILPPISAVVLWILMNRRFIEALNPAAGRR